ncbi:hypothetical protein KQH56_02520 [bacterium]|nr:hypothetical protein [bacterium]
MTEKRNNNDKIGTWMIFGFIIGAGLGVVLFPDNLAIGAGIGMCVGIFLAAMTEILTRNKQEAE